MIRGLEVVGSRHWRRLALAAVTASIACGDEPSTSQPPKVEEPVASSIALSTERLEFASLGETHRISATVYDQYGSVFGEAAAVWSSSNAAVVTVSDQGVVRAVANGSGTITASFSGVEASADVVVDQVVRRIRVTPEAVQVYPPGEIVQLSVSVADANGHAVVGQAVEWYSEDESVATVNSSGTVRVVAEGEVIITARAGEAEGSAEINVGFECFADLPSPELALKSVELEGAFTRYRLTVENRADFPAQLFTPAPDLAPCGRNTRSSRTWVEIHREDGSRLYGFCAFGSPEDLDLIWFGVGPDAAPPAGAYVVLVDRRCGITYRSNTVSIAP